MKKVECKMVEVCVTRDYEVLCDVEPAEDPDWDYARNRQILIKDVLLEYSTSSFDAPISTVIGILHGGNRDFSWQGLLVGPIENALYRVLDSLYYRPLDSEELKPLSVKARRSSADYVYVDEDCKTYTVKISVKTERNRGLLTATASRPSIFVPLFDLCNAESRARAPLRIAQGGACLIVESDAVPLRINISGFDEIREINQEFEWIYKLGDGFRTISDGKVVFVRHTRRVEAPVALTSNKGFICFELPLRSATFERIDQKVNWKLRKLHDRLKKLHGSAPPQILNAIVLRVDRLMSFGLPLNSALAPEAGAMWFRRTWSRDLLEGLRWNLLTYIKVLELSDWLVKLTRNLILIAYTSRGLKSLVDKGDYASDALPQLIDVAASLYNLTRNKALLKEALKLASMACKLLRTEEGFSGCKVQDGLALCKANSSWIDCLHDVEGVRWPLRLPSSWLGKVPPGGLFALVEVNALFIKGLDNLLKAARSAGLKVDEGLCELEAELIDGYRKWFHSDSRIPPLTVDPSSSLRDETQSSAGVTAIALLKNVVYDRAEVSKLWGCVENMLVRRKLVSLGDSWELFGVIARKTEEKPYLGDLEYHGPVVWPRDTPYLVEVMKLLSLDFYGLLINNLDHMISEGAVGYSNELFSLPVGSNPSYVGERSFNPVPVKNYAQYWSHWCDPYVEHFLSWR